MSDTPHRFATRLAALFQRLAENQVDAYLVLSSDAHLNEYGPIYQRRRAAITGFTGSAGAARIGKDIVNPLRQQLMHQQFSTGANDGFAFHSPILSL